MRTREPKSGDASVRAPAATPSSQKKATASGHALADDRAGADLQRKLQRWADEGAGADRASRLQAWAEPGAGGGVLQGVFVEALGGITEENFIALLALPEYGLSVDEQERVAQKFGEMEQADIKFYSVGQCVAKAFEGVMGPVTKTKTPWGQREARRSVGPEKEAKVTAAVHESLRAGGREAKAEYARAQREMVTLYRADSRTYDQLKAAGGMWGRDSGAVPASHARLLVQGLQKMSETQQNDWVQGWKASTKNPKEIVPYVATGKEAQKGGYEYKIEAPMTFTPFPNNEKLELGIDTDALETARVIAVKMRGDEVVFVTGIPIEFVSKP